MSAGQQCSAIHLVEAKSVTDAANFHGEEGINAGGIGDVIGVDVSVTKGQRSHRLLRTCDELAGAVNVEVVAQTSAIDQLGCGEIVGSVHVGIVLEDPTDHICRIAEAACSDRSGCGRSADQAGAPQSCRRPSGNHTPRTGRRQLHKYTTGQLGGCELDRRVGEVESIRPTTTVLPHHQHVGVGVFNDSASATESTRRMWLAPAAKAYAAVNARMTSTTTTAPTTSTTSRRATNRAPLMRQTNAHSASSKSIDHRRETFGISDHDMADTDVATQPFELVDDVFDRPDQQEWGFIDQLPSDAEAVRGGFNTLVRTAADVHKLHKDRPLDGSVPTSSRLFQPLRTLADGVLRASACRPRRVSGR